MSDSPILCTIDLEAPGKQVGRLQVPRSSNASGWSNQYVPIVPIANGDGPTAIVLGGVHGDEPEGQVAALNLARDLDRSTSRARDRDPVRLDRRRRAPTRASGRRART
jgi:predicted deacylase